MDGDYLNNGRLPASRDILQIVLHLFANSGGPPVGVREDGAPHHPTQLLGANPSPQITTPYNPWHTTSSIQQPPIQPLVGLLHNHNYTTLNNSCHTATSIKPSHTNPWLGNYATTPLYTNCLYTYFYIAAWALAISVSAQWAACLSMSSTEIRVKPDLYVS